MIDRTETRRSSRRGRRGCALTVGVDRTALRAPCLPSARTAPATPSVAPALSTMPSTSWPNAPPTGTRAGCPGRAEASCTLRPEPAYWTSETTTAPPTTSPRRSTRLTRAVSATTCKLTRQGIALTALDDAEQAHATGVRAVEGRQGAGIRPVRRPAPRPPHGPGRPRRSPARAGSHRAGRPPAGTGPRGFRPVRLSTAATTALVSHRLSSTASPCTRAAPRRWRCPTPPRSSSSGDSTASGRLR